MGAVKNILICVLLACIAMPATANSGERYVELSREIAACVEAINKELEKITDEKSSDDVYPELKKLVDRYMEATQELKTLEPPSSPAAVNEFAPLQEKMKEQSQQFMQARGNLTQAGTMSKKVESLLTNMVRKKKQ